MADVVLIFPITGIDVKGISVSLPLSVLCLAAPLEKEGYKVKIIDQRIDKDWKTMIEKEIKSRPLCVSISAMTGNQIKGGLEAAKLIRNLSVHTPIVWGGIHPSILPEQTISDKLVDMVVVGEGEKTLLDLVRALENKRSLNEVKGIYYKSNGSIFATMPQDLLDLDKTLPMPYHLINVKNYLNFLSLNNSVLLHFSSRGCPHSCKYCYNQSFNQRKWRYKSPEKFIEELKTIKRFGVSSVSLADDDFFADKNRVEKICDILNKESLSLNLKVSCRIDYVLKFSDDYLKMLKDLGVSTFYIGIESGSERILSMLNKGITVEDILLANRKLKNAKISSYYSFMAGLPTETLEDINKTLSLMLRLSNENEFVHILPIKAYTPYPGTDLFNTCLEYGFKQPDVLYEWGKFKWSASCASWLDERIKDFVDKVFYLTIFLDGKSLQELKGIQNNKLFKSISNIYTRIARYRINRKLYQFCPEIEAVRFVKKLIL